MQFTITIFTAIAAMVVSSEGVMTWQCHMQCGQAITAFKKCTGSKNYNDCLCAASSAFQTNVSACLKCGDEAWMDYGPSLTVPMAQCNIAQPVQPAESVLAANNSNDSDDNTFDDYDSDSGDDIDDEFDDDDDSIDIDDQQHQEN